MLKLSSMLYYRVSVDNQPAAPADACSGAVFDGRTVLLHVHLQIVQVVAPVSR